MRHVRNWGQTAGFSLLVIVSVALTRTAAANDGVFVRFRLSEPKGVSYHVRLGGYIHKSPWYLPKAVLPEAADKDPARRLDSGQFTSWFDLAEHAGDRLHGRLNRSGGVAELPNVTADFICDPAADRRTVIIQLATDDSADHVVRQWEESFSGSLTSFLVSPRLARDGSSLETAAEMTARRLDWARAATGGTRHSPERLIVQTSFWGPQRTELNLREAEVLKQREKENAPAAHRVFYYTSRFRQHAATERILWHTKAFHKHFPGGALTSTLVADHPYFAGSGLGMGTTPNPAWGNYPLSCDWFDLGRSSAVDLIGIEDWMGLQYMYGPNWTWEGFQLMGFQAAIFRSAGRGSLPIIAWITPSDETNLRLKTASALCQGARHFFYWTYGPTATSTENYWSDLRGAYDGIAAVTRQLAAAEHILAPGRPRRTRVALLYSISSDLWQPFGYVHMLERRGLYLSLIHDQFLVDVLSEEDVQAGRLAEYDVLYTADPCIATSAAEQIAAWVRQGGHLFATTAAGSRNEFNEPSSVLASVFGIGPGKETTVQPGRYHIRGALNDMAYLDSVHAAAQPPGESPSVEFGAIGTKTRLRPTTGQVTASFGDGSPAVVKNDFGRGTAQHVGTCPAIAYLKDANFVPAELAEQWPPEHRRFINHTAAARGARPIVELSHSVVECGAYDAAHGSALVLANFTYEPIKSLEVRMTLPRPVRKIRSIEHGQLPFTTEATAGHPQHRTAVSFQLPLSLTDIVLAE